MAGRSGPAASAAASAAAAAAAAARSPTGLILLASLLGCSELVDGWNCQAEFGDNCQVRSGPQANQSYEEWVSHYRAWRAEGRAAFNFSAFDTPGVSWARTSFVQPQAMLHDRYLYDRSTHKWTVDKFLDDLTTRYGGIDSVLLWQFYPNAGIDSRNNFDYIDSLPGGKAAAKQLVADFHRHGVKVLWPYFPWDVGTNNTGQPQYVSQIAWMKELGADGFNGDTVRGINISFWHEAISQHTPLVMEPEIMGNKGQKWTGTGLSTNVMSWGYWPYQKTPVVDAFKTLEPRHMTHISERWATDRTDGLHHAFFNGIGYESWENVWGIFNKLTPFHGGLLKRMTTILRGLDGITSSKNTEFNPHVPYTCATVDVDADDVADCSRPEPNVFMSEFKNDTVALYTIVNRDDTGTGALWSGAREGSGARPLRLSLPCQKGMRFFDLYAGKELGPGEDTARDRCIGCENDVEDVDGSCWGRVEFSVAIEPAGIGAVLSLLMMNAKDVPKHPSSTFWLDNQAHYDGQITAINGIMKTMSILSEGPVLNRLDKTWKPLQQTLTENAATPITPAAPPGMVTVPGGAFSYESANNCIEGDTLDAGVGVQMPWQVFPSRSHKQLIRMPSFHIDKHLVTNEEYRAFTDRGDNLYFSPTDRQNWLKDWPGGMIPSGWNNHPVRWVSRTDADQYCRYYGKRLPTSWEWQYAAQGTDGRRYPWGNSWDPDKVAELSNDRTDPPTEEIGARPDAASPFGVEDMIGHLYQWTDESCDEHTCRGVLRGGSNYYPLGSNWYFPQPGCVNGACYKDTPRGDLTVHNTLLLLSDSMDRSASVGFRCVVDAEPPPVHSRCQFQLCASLETRARVINGSNHGGGAAHPKRSKYQTPNDDWSDDSSHDLTAEGAAGWIVWGADPDCVSTDPADCQPVSNEKRGYEHAIRATAISGEFTPFDAAAHSLAYTDGVLPLSANIATGVVVQGIDNGFRIHLPPSLNQRTVATIYVGVYLGRGELRITLDDGQTRYNDHSLVGLTSMVSGVYTIEYETLDKWPIEARWVLVESTASSRAGVEPSVALQAVTLSTTTVDPPGTIAPPIGGAGDAAGGGNDDPSSSSPGGLLARWPVFQSWSPEEVLAGVLVVGVLIGCLIGVPCGRRAGVKAVERDYNESYELDDWAELEESLGPMVDDDDDDDDDGGHGGGGREGGGAQQDSDHWPTIEQTYEPPSLAAAEAAAADEDGLLFAPTEEPSALHAELADESGPAGGEGGTTPSAAAALFSNEVTTVGNEFSVGEESF